MALSTPGSPRRDRINQAVLQPGRKISPHRCCLRRGFKKSRRAAQRWLGDRSGNAGLTRETVSRPDSAGTRETALEWGGGVDRQEIPQIGEFFSTGDREDVFRTKNIMVPMLTIAVAVAVWTPVTIAACKWKAGGIDCRYPSPGQNSHTSDRQQWRFFIA